MVIALWLVGMYNSLIGRRNTVKNAWSDIDVQLKRRFDLVPNLVETVSGYAGHEKSVLENVTAARSAVMNAQAGSDLKQRVEAENILTGALKSLFAVAENYPQLKASDVFGKLQDQLSQIETDIQGARRYYNAAVREFATAVQVFPTNVFASMFGFSAPEFFGAKEEEKEAVKVSF